MPNYVRGFKGKTITPSMLNAAQFCRPQAWRHYGPLAVEQAPIPQAIRGVAVHEVMQEMQMLRSKGELADPELVREWITSAAEKYEQDAKDITRCVKALGRATQGCQPVGVEIELTYPLEDGWQLAGTVDFYTVDIWPTIGDWKTTDSFDKWNERKAQYSAQTTGYTWLLERHLNNGLAASMTYYIVDVATGMVKTIPVKTGLPAQMKMLVKAIELTHMLSSETPPESEAPDRCAKWCKYKDNGYCGRIE